jgi:hypothetical protein
MSSPDSIEIKVSETPVAVVDKKEIVSGQASSGSSGSNESSGSNIGIKEGDNDSNSIIGSYEPEKDTLNEQDSKPVHQITSNIEELTRLFRAITVLTPLQIRVIELRYLSLIISYERRIKYVDVFHHFTRSFVSLGSVAVPALLSIQSPTSANSIGLYWLTWIISLAVTCIHNFITIFRFDKKFYALHMIYEKLQTEGWSYLQLSGRYSGQYGYPVNPPEQIVPTHRNQYNLFVHTIEKLQMKQVSNEYNGIEDKVLPPGTTAVAPTNDSLSPPNAKKTSPS